MTTFQQAAAADVAALAVKACADTWKGIVSVPEAARRLREYDCFRIAKDGNGVGVVIMQGTNAHIAVLPMARKAWAGRSFYRFLEAETAKRGRLTVRCGNDGAERFIRKLEARGFLTCEN